MKILTTAWAKEKRVAQRDKPQVDLLANDWVAKDKRLQQYFNKRLNEIMAGQGHVLLVGSCCLSKSTFWIKRALSNISNTRGSVSSHF